MKVGEEKDTADALFLYWRRWSIPETRSSWSCHGMSISRSEREETAPAEKKACGPVKAYVLSWAGKSLYLVECLPWDEFLPVHFFIFSDQTKIVLSRGFASHGTPRALMHGREREVSREMSAGGRTKER